MENVYRFVGKVVTIALIGFVSMSVLIFICGHSAKTLDELSKKNAYFKVLVSDSNYKGTKSK